MNKYIEDVAQFHKTFGHPINDKKDVIDLKTRQLRNKLIFEENEELAEASDVRATFYELCKDYIEKYEANPIEDGDNVDKVEELDALCDIQYVLSGAVLATGHQENFDEAFQNVQDSNMSKGCKNQKEADATQKHYADKGVESYVVDKDDILIVLRKGDDKVLKNVYYNATELEQFV
jgi:predicted HAD superfamily Cof-like phosphohydrolase